MLWQAELLDDAYLFAHQLPGRFTELLQRQFEVRDVSRLDADELAADKVDGQAIAASDQHLQVGLIAIERAFAVLPNAAINDGEVGFDAAVHVYDGLVDAEGVHGTAIRSRQNAHGIFHTERHSRNDVRFQDRQINQARLGEDTRDAETAQAPGTFWPQFDPVLLPAFRVYFDDANAVFLAELFNPQDSVGSITIKLGARGFTQDRLCSTCAYFFGDGFEESKTGG